MPSSAANSHQHTQNGRLWCEKCKKPNYSIDTCWRIHGKPVDLKSSKEHRANATAAASSQDLHVPPQPFTQEQLDVLHRRLKKALYGSNSLIGIGFTVYGCVDKRNIHTVLVRSHFNRQA